jgi:hypothetical protein
MQGESAAPSGYHAANVIVGQTEDHTTEAAMYALANLAIITTTDRGVVATLPESNARLEKELEDTASELRDLKALMKKERTESRGQCNFNLSPSNNFLTHGYKVVNIHTSLSCNFPTQGHNRGGTRADNMGGSQANKE